MTTTKEQPYWGFMVCEFDGSVNNLYCETYYKPKHEICGFSFAKWFNTEMERDKIKEYTINAIKEIQNKRGLI